MGNLLVPRAVGGVFMYFGRRYEAVFELSVTRLGLAPQALGGQMGPKDVSAPGSRLGSRSLGFGEATLPSPAAGDAEHSD